MDEKNRTGNVLKNSTASMLEKAVHVVVQFVIRTVFINVLGNEYTGISGLFTDILQVLSLMELGLDSSMIYSLYLPLAEGDTKKIAALLKFYRTAFRIIAVIVLLSGIACIPALPYIVKNVPSIAEDIRIIFLIYVLTSASSYILIYKSVLLRADQKSRIISEITILVSAVECFVEAILLIIFKQFYIYLIVKLIATIGKNIIISRYASNKYEEYFSDYTSYLTEGEKKKLYQNLIYITIYNLSGVVINSTDSVFISAFVGTAEVAIIGNFTLIINSIRTATNQAINAAKPSIGNLAATETREKQEQVFYRINFVTFWITCFCCTCLFVLLNPFVGDIWFNPSYTVSNTIIAILVINFFIAVMIFPVESFRVANGMFREGWIRPAIMAFLNVIFDFFWGRQWGIVGIFIATTISRLLTQVWFDPYLVYKKVFFKKPWRYFTDYIKYASLTTVSCTFAYLLCRAIPNINKYFRFSLSIFVVVLIPNLLIFILYHNSEEFHYLISIIYKIKCKVLAKNRRI